MDETIIPPLRRVDIVITDKHATARPVKWDSIPITPDKKNKDGEYIKPIEYEVSCPLCGLRVTFDARLLSVRCPHCKKGEDRLLYDELDGAFCEPGQFDPAMTFTIEEKVQAPPKEIPKPISGPVVKPKPPKPPKTPKAKSIPFDPTAYMDKDGTVSPRAAEFIKRVQEKETKKVLDTETNKALKTLTELPVKKQKPAPKGADIDEELAQLLAEIDDVPSTVPQKMEDYEGEQPPEDQE